MEVHFNVDLLIDINPMLLSETWLGSKISDNEIKLTNDTYIELRDAPGVVVWLLVFPLTWSLS